MFKTDADVKVRADRGKCRSLDRTCQIVPSPVSRPAATSRREEKEGGSELNSSHAHHVKKATGALHISRGGLEGPLPPLRGGGWVGVPLQKPPSSALSLPCEIVSISQGRPLLAPEFTTSGQEEAGKGLKIPVCRGSSLHATPFR
jgi:hypothetical protein